MANPEQLEILGKGVKVWNKWREDQPGLKPDLSRSVLDGKDLSGANFLETDFTLSRLEDCLLNGTNLMGANLQLAKLRRSRLIGADLFYGLLRLADLSEADLSEANLGEANLTGACLAKAIVRRADLLLANLTGADLSEAVIADSNLSRSIFNDANLTKAHITNCYVYGIATWNVNSEGSRQSNLRIGGVEVDNLDVAHFIHLILDDKKLRYVIDTITSKVVLILGRFTPDRKRILDAVRDELRNRNYLPVLFDFDKPNNRDITETVSTLAHMARFVIADITDAKSIPQELMRIVPALPSVPVQPLLLASQREYGMFEHFKRFPWVLEPFLYDDQDALIGSLDSRVVGPAEKKAREQTGR